MVKDKVGGSAVGQTIGVITPVKSMVTLLAAVGEINVPRN
jgi:hypothetical protein